MLFLVAPRNAQRLALAASGRDAGKAWQQDSAEALKTAKPQHIPKARLRVQYVDIGAVAYEQKQREREIVYLQKKAAKLGFMLTPHEPALAAGHA